MDALIARADAIRPLSEPKKGKARESSSSNKTQANAPKSKGKSKAKESNDDYTLQSISSRASIPKSLVNLPSSDPSSSSSSSKDAAAAPKYTHIANKKLRDQLVRQHTLSTTLSRTALDTQDGLLALAADGAGAIQLTGPLEKTWGLSQTQIQAGVGGEASRGRRELTFGPGEGAQRMKWTRNGRHLVFIHGKGGSRVSSVDWLGGKVNCQVDLLAGSNFSGAGGSGAGGEGARDVTFLQDQSFFAVAQKRNVYVYDKDGVESQSRIQATVSVNRVQGEQDKELEAAVEYCDDPRSAPMKDALRTSLSATAERDRYHPLVHSLNTILLAFHDTKIGKFRDGRDFLYVVNDPATLRSAPLSVAEDAPQTRSYTISLRKPDIFDPTKDHLKKLIPENEDFTFAQWVDFIHHCLKEVDLAMKDASKEKKTTWGDGSQCLELQFREALKKDFVPLAPGYKFKAEKFPAASSRGSRGSSRGSGDSSTGSVLGKRSRSRASVDSTGSKSRKDRDGKKKSSLSPEAQCALYGIELLRSSWDRTHAIVILLKDNILSLRWYDAQGCISTYPIDVVAQLPLLVTTILLFQRFGDRMRGNSGIKLEGEANGRKFKFNVPDDAHSGWQLKGRRRVTATLIVERPPSTPAHPRATCQNARGANTTEPLPRDDELFFKLSWREHTRQSEGFVVQTAKERAVKFHRYRNCAR